MRISLLGSTGSIGRSILEVVRKYRDRFEVLALAAGENVKLLREQIKEFSPSYVSVKNREAAEALSSEFKQVQFFHGEAGLEHLACLPEADLVVIALSGQAGIKPTFKAVREGKRVALANKESLVSAGHLIMMEKERSGSVVIPVDSEHNALMQIIEGREKDLVKVFLTASGGPFFRNRPSRITVKEALNHPTWKMGKKITIDSATLMNKAFEMVEARWLFSLKPEQIDVLIHPQSIMHAIVLLKDGAMLAHLSKPDMRIPILYALTWPERLDPGCGTLSLADVKNLEFYEPDIDRFPSLKLAREMLKQPPSFSAVVNTANDIAVEAFLKGEISFDSIVKVIFKTLERHDAFEPASLEELLNVIKWAEQEADKIIEELR